MKKAEQGDAYLLNAGGLPRGGLTFLRSQYPDAADLNDDAYLPFVLTEIAAAMFPSAEQQPEIGVHGCDSEGSSALHYACSWGDLRAVRLLVEAGADVNKLADMDETPLQIAVHSRFLDIIEFLLAHGAKKDQKDAFGYTPLGWAKQIKYSDVVELLERR